MAGKVKIYSITRTERELGPDRIAKIVDDGIAQLEAVAFEVFGAEADITIRDLRPTDLPGPTNEEWTEATGSNDNTEEASDMAANTAIDDNLCICIWGCRILTAHANNALPITYMTVSVGNARRAWWSVVDKLVVKNAGTSAGEISGQFGGFYTDSPIIVRQNQNLEIRYYTINTTVTFVPVFLGAAAERVGRTLNP